MSKYPLIADHGLIGNMQTAALITIDGTIDWFCAPRFDSPSIFGCLLDHDRGGHLRTRPTADAFTQQQLYYPDTAILVTRFLTEAGVGEVVDFMPVANSTVASDRHQLVRMIRCVRGEMTFAVDIAPRFDYGRESHETHVTEDGIVFQGARSAMSLNLIREPDDARLARVNWPLQKSCMSSSHCRQGRCGGLSWKPVRLDLRDKYAFLRPGSSLTTLFGFGGRGSPNPPIQAGGERRCNGRRSLSSS